MSEEQVQSQETEIQVEETVTEEQKAAEEQARLEAEEQERKDQEATEQKPWFKKRFDEITKQKYAEKQRADDAERKAKDLENRIKRLEAATNQANPQPESARPRLEDFEAKIYDPDQAKDAYLEALADWKIDQREKAAQERAKQQAEQQKRDNEAKTFEQKRIATIAAGKSKHSDWEETVFSMPGAIMNQSLASAIFELNNGADVSYYLGKNLQEAERISQLSPFAMAAELGKIEAKLTTNETKQTKAPPPLSTVKANTPAESTPDPSKDIESWVDQRNRGAI